MAIRKIKLTRANIICNKSGIKGVETAKRETTARMRVRYGDAEWNLGEPQARNWPGEVRRGNQVLGRISKSRRHAAASLKLFCREFLPRWEGGTEAVV